MTTNGATPLLYTTGASGSNNINIGASGGSGYNVITTNGSYQIASSGLNSTSITYNVAPNDIHVNDVVLPDGKLSDRLALIEGILGIPSRNHLLESKYPRIRECWKSFANSAVNGDLEKVKLLREEYCKLIEEYTTWTELDAK